MVLHVSDLVGCCGLETAASAMAPVGRRSTVLVLAGGDSRRRQQQEKDAYRRDGKSEQ